jgi:hypothetical protein
VRIKTRLAQFALYALLVLSGAPLAAEESSATCSQEEWDEYFITVQNHVISHWDPPMKYRPISCTILLRLDFRSEVAHVEIIDCNDDEEIRKSAENAAYGASPLPKPRNKACLSKQMTVRLVFTP